MRVATYLLPELRGRVSVRLGAADGDAPGECMVHPMHQAVRQRVATV